MSETIHTPTNEIHDLLRRHASSHTHDRDNIYGVIDTYDLAGEQSFTGAERTVPIDTVRKNDAQSGVFVLGVGASFGQITVTRKMEVEVSARIGVGIETGDTFGDVEAWLEVDGVEVAGSKMFL